MRQIWDILQIEPTTDKRAVKRAYANRAKEIHPEEKPEEFQRLFEAYQSALQYASRGGRFGGKQAPPGGDGRTIQNVFSGEKTAGYPTHFEEPGTEQAKEEAEIQNGYERLGLDSEAARRERIRLEEIAYFRSWWKKRLIVWSNSKTFSDKEWKSYLVSDAFREIMWSPMVLKDLISGIRRYCMQKEEVLLFFWDLYELESPGERAAAGAGLQLYRVLYPAYTNRVKRLQYEKNREEIKKKERRRGWRLAISIAGIVILLLVLIVVLSWVERMEEGVGKMLVGYLLFGGLIFAAWLFWHFIIRG